MSGTSAQFTGRSNRVPQGNIAKQPVFQEDFLAEASEKVNVHSPRIVVSCLWNYLSVVTRFNHKNARADNRRKSSVFSKCAWNMPFSMQAPRSVRD
ncbi:hypothetical protein V6N12_067442 [Hibiscus sabdariffa]|uniref:Uncharacterized protein n=1 Tax=Hibiscus sabdariffa TaxID=183260 RepID=A0ABR1Z807_9ROSI